MTRIYIRVIILLAVCWSSFVAIQAEEGVYVLASGRVGEAYQENIPQVLSSQYKLRLESSSASPSFQWSLVEREMPAGLELKADGTLNGTPQTHREEPYRFRVKVTDRSMREAEPLEIDLQLAIKPPRIRLVKTNAVRLVPTATTKDPDPPKANIKTDPSKVNNKTGSSEGNNKKENEWEARAIVGFHQAGASASQNKQAFFFDFFILRALSAKPLWESPWNLWGNVRVASVPQQISTPVAEFASNFAQRVGQLKVNELAQSAEFQTGLEYHVPGLKWEYRKKVRTVGLIASFGATGPLQPKETLSIFEVPASNSPQFARFAAQYPSAVNSKYVGFISPDRDRFFRQYGIGFRVTTSDKEATNATNVPPATYAVTFGQDEVITGGRFRSVVGRVDVFYPLPIGEGGKYKFIYLFGTAALRLSKATNTAPFVLREAPNIMGYDPNVAIITAPSNRDTYRIGAGVDLVSLIQAMNPKPPNTEPPKTEPPKTEPPKTEPPKTE